MKITIITITVIIVLILAYLAYQGHVSKIGSAAGLVDGQLGACPDKPNCVCSEYPQDRDHAIEPIAMQGESSEAELSRLKNVIEAKGGKIMSASEDYIAATFTSKLFGFVDDLEIRLDPEARLIHLRSASRVGTSDFGANSKRVEMIRQSYRELQ